jgi:hypothetical protein
MLTCFNLAPETTIEEFRRSLAGFTRHLLDLGLIYSRGPIGRRQKDTIMDTDHERDHDYYFLMSFRDRAQSDRAVEHIYAHKEPGESIHRSLFSKIRDESFICWEVLSGAYGRARHSVGRSIGAPRRHGK